MVQWRTPESNVQDQQTPDRSQTYVGQLDITVIFYKDRIKLPAEQPVPRYQTLYFMNELAILVSNACGHDQKSLAVSRYINRNLTIYIAPKNSSTMSKLVQIGISV